MILETHTTERDAREAALHLSTEGVEASVGAAHGVFTLSVRSGDVALAVALLELRRLRQVPSAPTPQGRPGRWAALAVCSSLALAGASAWLVGAGVRGPDGVELVELDSDRRADGFNQRDTEGRLRIAHTDVDRDGRLDRAVVVGRGRTRRDDVVRRRRRRHLRPRTPRGPGRAHGHAGRHGS